MKIGIETSLINGHDGGTRYTNEVLVALCKLYPDVEFFAIGPPPQKSIPFDNLTFIPYYGMDTLKERLLYTLNVHKILKNYKIDLFHLFTHYGIYFSPCPVIVGVFDLLTLKYPYLRKKKIEWFLYKYYLPHLLNKASHVITLSENSKKDINFYYKLNNITVTYCGYDKDIFNIKPNYTDELVLEKFNIKSNYLLFVGYVTPKKNIEIIIKALHILKTVYGLQPQFIIAGKLGYSSQSIFDLIDKYSLNDQVKMLGFVSDNEIIPLYRKARLFVFPSIYEGFGIPVIESMACGTPVLVSDAGSLPELVVQNQYTCPPFDVEMWAEKILMFFKNDEFYYHAKEWCLRQASMFSWEECAHKTMNVYKSILL